MIQHERIDISEGTDFGKTNNSVECMSCDYYYFKDVGFKYQPYTCNACHDFLMIVQSLDDFAILKNKNVDYRCYVVGMNKKDAISLLKNSVLDNNRVL